MEIGVILRDVATAGLLHVRDEIPTLLLGLDTGKAHFCALDVALRVLQVSGIFV